MGTPTGQYRACGHKPKDDDNDNVDGCIDIDHSDRDDDPEPEEDYFATDGCEPVLNPDNIIWDPRFYFLRAAQTRLSNMSQAPEYLVRKLESGCDDWVRCQQLLPPRSC